MLKLALSAAIVAAFVVVGLAAFGALLKQGKPMIAGAAGVIILMDAVDLFFKIALKLSEAPEGP